MLQDINPHHLINHYEPDARPQEQDIVMAFKGDMILLKLESDVISFPTTAFFSDGDRKKMVYLFAIDGQRFFWLEDGNETGKYTYTDINDIRRGNYRPQEYVYALMTAIHLVRWYRNNRYCGRCGNLVIHDEKERAVFCPVCGKKEYPRINPAVIVGVVNGDRILLTKYRTGYSRNALVAGFTEIGETLEETVEREVMEEAGIRVKNIRYYKSQPWGIAADILAGFYCDVDGDDTITMDSGELKEASWVERKDIVLQENEYSLTNEMMRRFMEGKIC